DSNMTLNALLTGGAQFIEYRVSGANAMFSTIGTEAFYAADGTTPFYGPDGVYQPWPGQITAKNLQYQFRFSTGQGATQGTIDTCKETIDVPDVSEILNDIVIAAAGTRLPITKHYSFIKNIQLTLQADGGTARAPIIIDKNATLGPLIKCVDASGTFVQGLIDAVPQGY
ncbi:MAG: hypothetical protein JWQ10_2077, partial [Herbaspirillum sp.]|nr:hypothetical protein [Herbaspirillum sp.]